jgi:hypothetical protein
MESVGARQTDGLSSRWKGYRTRWPYFAPMRVLSALGVFPQKEEGRPPESGRVCAALLTTFSTLLLYCSIAASPQWRIGDLNP